LCLHFSSPTNTHNQNQTPRLQHPHNWEGWGGTAETGLRHPRAHARPHEKQADRWNAERARRPWTSAKATSTGLRRTRNPPPHPPTKPGVVGGLGVGGGGGGGHAVAGPITARRAPAASKTDPRAAGPPGTDRRAPSPHPIDSPLTRMNYTPERAPPGCPRALTHPPPHPTSRRNPSKITHAPPPSDPFPQREADGVGVGGGCGWRGEWGGGGGGVGGAREAAAARGRPKAQKAKSATEEPTQRERNFLCLFLFVLVFFFKPNSHIARTLHPAAQMPDIPESRHGHHAGEDAVATSILCPRRQTKQQTKNQPKTYTQHPTRTIQKK